MLADDLVQETMTTALSKSRQLRNQDQLFAWLYSIMRNGWYRHLRRDRAHLELDEQLPALENGPLGSCQELEIVARVRRAVASLPVEQREVIALVDLEELSYCEVAEVLEIPIGTVMSRLHRARKNLLRRMDALPSGGKADADGQDHVRLVK